LPWGRALGPFGGLSTGQLCCLPRAWKEGRKERKKEGRKVIKYQLSGERYSKARTHLWSTPGRGGSSLKTGLSSGWPCTVQEQKFKIPLPRNCAARLIERACRVSSTSAQQRSRSLPVLKMFTPDRRTHGWTDQHLTGLISHLGRDE